MEIRGEGLLLLKRGFRLQGLASTRSCSRKFGRDGMQQSPNHHAGWKLKSVAVSRGMAFRATAGRSCRQLLQCPSRGYARILGFPQSLRGGRVHRIGFRSFLHEDAFLESEWQFRGHAQDQQLAGAKQRRK